MSGEPFTDYYELLQVSPNADDDTIHRVFRHLAKKYHPDGPGHGDSKRFNVLVEALYQRIEDVTGTHRVTRSAEETIAPGVRWSYDFPSGLQIVPGVAVPIGVGPSRHERSVLLYLSFEHPFLRSGRHDLRS